MTELVNKGKSPFEALKRVDEWGEHWMGRELMPHADYHDWRNFQRAINEARSAMSAHYDLRDHFALVSLPKNPDQQERGRGRPANVTDWKLSRMACRFVFMNGDPNKPAIKAAQTYFAEQTEFAENVQQAIVQQSFRIPQTLQEALRAYADEVDAREKAELQAAEAQAEADMLRPPAEAWNYLVDADKDYSMAEAAAILNNDPTINTGRDRLRDWMLGNRMLYRNADGQLVPYASHLKHIRLKPRTRPNYDADDPRARKDAPSQVRLTPDGLSWIQQRMREQSRPELLQQPLWPATVQPPAEPEPEPPVNFDAYRLNKLTVLRDGRVN
jgi:DNA-damage-inducible protein D